MERLAGSGPPSPESRWRQALLFAFYPKCNAELQKGFKQRYECLELSLYKSILRKKCPPEVAWAEGRGKSGRGELTHGILQLHRLRRRSRSQSLKAPGILFTVLTACTRTSELTGLPTVRPFLSQQRDRRNRSPREIVCSWVATQCKSNFRQPVITPALENPWVSCMATPLA